MGTILYYVTIFPLESLMKWVLEFVYHLSGSYGIGLIAVSMTVSIGVLPLYHIAEKWQDAERAIQKKMKARADELKEVFSGQELHSYLSVLYRQHGYNPLYALRSMTGLLIQIPFFIAAYHLLDNYEPLKGVSFLGIRNLAKSDSLLVIQMIKINVLPYLMTLINLVSSAAYSKKIDSYREKIQIYVIALLFLVLLYKSPSALLLYWTCNNIFSLLKNIFYRFTDKQYSLEKKPLLLCDVKPLRKVYDFLLSRFGKSPVPAWLYLSFFLFTLMLYLNNYLSFARNDRNDYVEAFFFLSVIVVSALSLISLFVRFACSAKGSNFFIWSFCAWLVSLLLVYNYYTRVNLVQLYKTSSLAILSLLIASFIVVGLYDSLIQKISIIISRKNAAYLFLLSVIGITLLVFVAIPASVLQSGSLLDFEQSFFYYIRPSIIAGAIFSVMLGALYFLLPQRVRPGAAAALFLVLILQLGNAYIFNGRYGDMSNLVFQKGLIVPPMQVILNFVYHFGAVIFIIFVIRKECLDRCIQAAVLIAVVLVTVSAFNIGSYNKTHSGSAVSKSAKVSSVMRLSRSGKNVVVLMLDRYVGGYFAEALASVPSFGSDLDGFTFYPNVVSNANCTIGAAPALLGGYEYSVQKINSEKSTVELKERINRSARIMPYNFDKAGYSTTLVDVGTPVFDVMDTKYVKNTRFENPKEICYIEWLAEHPQSNPGSDDIPAKLAVFSLFRAAPPLFRTTIYDRGNWLLGSKSDDSAREGYAVYHPQKTEMLKAVKYYSVLDYLPRMTQIGDDAANNFVLMFNNASHEPWTYNENFELDLSGTIDYRSDVIARFGNDIESAKHFYGDTSVFVVVNRWIKYLQQSGVYDNTRIIIVSDHGRDLNIPKLISDERKAGVDSRDRAYNYPLMLIKDFGERGTLKEDSTFMTTADVPWISFKGILEGENPYTGNKIAEPETKVPLEVVHVPFNEKENQRTKFNYLKRFKLVKPDIFDPEAWENIR